MDSVIDSIFEHSFVIKLGFHRFAILIVDHYIHVDFVVRYSLKCEPLKIDPFLCYFDQTKILRYVPFLPTFQVFMKVLQS